MAFTSQQGLFVVLDNKKKISLNEKTKSKKEIKEIKATE